MEKHTYKVIKDVAQLDTSAFVFNWRTISNHPQRITIGAYVANDLAGLITFERRGDGFDLNYVHNLETAPSYQGHGTAGKLLALVMIDSFNNGFDGYVQLVTKLNGVETLYDHLGAKPISRQQLYFDTKTSQRVINKYLPNGGKINGL